MTDTVALSVAPVENRRRSATRIFRGAFVFNACLTILWLYAVARNDGSAFAHGYRVDGAAMRRVFLGILFFYVIWGFIWWGVKRLLLRHFVGFTKDDSRVIFLANAPPV